MDSSQWHKVGSEDVYMALICACTNHGAITCIIHSKQVCDMEPYNAGVHALLSNIYAAVGKWDLKCAC
jgi:hypothetical protein